MPKIIKHREIPLKDFVIDVGQARTDDPGAEVNDLVNSIRTLGLLQPIVVCKAKKSEDSDKWEILAGQRRFLAHKLLNLDTISTIVLDGRVTEEEAKAISITENLIRRKLTSKELIDGITFLYNRYGSITNVVNATGLSYNTVRMNVKYTRLVKELKTMVDKGELDLKIALWAQDAATIDAETNIEDAIMLAIEMSKMSGMQRKKVVSGRKENPTKNVEDVIEEAKSGTKITQITVTITQDTNKMIQKYANDKNVKKEEAVSDLIEEALSNYVFIES